MRKRIALFPGSFDPLTNGHVDLIRRGRLLFDELIVGIFQNTVKQSLFSMSEREVFIQRVVQSFPGVSVRKFEGKLVSEAAKLLGASCLLRGIRSVRDYEYEREIAQLNREISDELETVFLLANPKHAHISSSVLKEIHSFGGEIAAYVPEEVFQALREKKLES